MVSGHSSISSGANQRCSRITRRSSSVWPLVSIRPLATSDAEIALVRLHRHAFERHELDFAAEAFGAALGGDPAFLGKLASCRLRVAFAGFARAAR